MCRRGVRLNIGGSLHDPTDPIGRLLFTTLSMIAEFEADLARARTREGMAVARAKGRLRGKQPKLSRGTLPRHPVDDLPSRSPRRRTHARAAGETEPTEGSLMKPDERCRADQDRSQR